MALLEEFLLALYRGALLFLHYSQEQQQQKLDLTGNLKIKGQGGSILLWHRTLPFTKKLVQLGKDVCLGLLAQTGKYHTELELLDTAKNGIYFSM